MICVDQNSQSVVYVKPSERIFKTKIAFFLIQSVMLIMLHTVGPLNKFRLILGKLLLITFWYCIGLPLNLPCKLQLLNQK